MFTKILCALGLAQVSTETPAQQKRSQPASLKIPGLAPRESFLGYLSQKVISSGPLENYLHNPRLFIENIW